MLTEVNKIYMPYDDILKAGGIVMALKNRWWTCDKDKGLLFYRHNAKERLHEASPQCNSEEATARKLNEALWPDHEIRFFELVLQPINISDYV